MTERLRTVELRCDRKPGRCERPTAVVVASLCLPADHLLENGFCTECAPSFLALLNAGELGCRPCMESGVPDADCVLHLLEAIELQAVAS